MEELSFGVLMASVGTFCVIMGWSRKAHSPRVATVSGMLLLVFGAFIISAERFGFQDDFFYGGAFLALAILCLMLDITKQQRMKRCVQPCQAVFCGVINYDTVGNPSNQSLRRLATKFLFVHVDCAVFRYRVQDQEKEQAAIDYRIRTCLQTSSFLKQYQQGGEYTIYLDPNRPESFVTARKGFRLTLLNVMALVCAVLAAVLLL